MKCQELNENLDPIKRIIKSIVKGNPNFYAQGGKCFEFAEELAKKVKSKHPQYKVNIWDSITFLRYNSKVKKGWAFTNNLESNSHAWVEINKKHYDSLNSAGVDHPKDLEFFKETFRDSYLPDEDEKLHRWLEYRELYSEEKDDFVKTKLKTPPNGYFEDGYFDDEE